MLPTRKQAEELLREAETHNPGAWGDHSRIAAHCAEKIARECGDLDSDKAYILGLLHDIGRKFGVRHLGHVADVKRRYGFYPQEKWDSNLQLKKHFEEKMGKDIYIVAEKDSFKLWK